MRVLEKISINLAFGLVILLLFLSIISATPVVPEWLQVFGRMHMLLLHLPIGIWAVLLVLAIFTPPQGAAASARSFRLLLALAVLTGAASAFMGFVLATEGGYTADALQNHRLGGIAIAVLGLVFWMGYTWRPMPLVWLRGGLLAMLIVITLTGHWGANLTHGADFVWAPLQTEPTEETALSDTLFLAHIQPLLEEKCVSCHNDNKQKGELNMTTFALLEKGGENGPIWNTVAPSQSAMLVRAHLPLEHEEHMPPEGKPQLTAAEINLLQAWITAGASSSQTISSLDENAPLALAVNAILPATSNQAYDLPAADPQVVATLNSPFMQVRSVGPGSNGLEAKFFIRKNYDPVRLQNLIKIAPQLVGLDLSNMPVKDEELAGVAQFPELRTLLLNGTNISNEGLVALQGLTKLERVGLVGIPVSSEATAEIAQLPALKSIYLWDTPLQREDFAALAKIHPQIHFDRGYQPDTSEMLKLSPPALKGDKVGIYPYGEMLTLKSFFPGSEIRYTLDGTEPDSLESPLFSGPEIPITDYTIVKARCFLPGWISSESKTFALFPSSEIPSEMELLQEPMGKFEHTGVEAFFDGVRGSIYGYWESYWMGFEANPLELLVKFEPGDIQINKMAISYLEQTGGRVFPPAKIELWAGETPETLKQVHVERYRLPRDHLKPNAEGISLPIPPYQGPYLKLIIHPVKRMPYWHKDAGKPGRLFIDELFFYREVPEALARNSR